MEITTNQKFRECIDIEKLLATKLPAKLPEGTYIAVNIVWAVGPIAPKEGSKRTNHRDEFIFADHSGHIKAKVFFDEKEADSAQNLRNILLKNSQHKIRNFRMENVNPEFKWNTGIRDQEMELILQLGTTNIEAIEEDPSKPLPRFLPFRFTMFDHEHIDTLADGVSIDIIGYVSKLKNTQRESNQRKEITLDSDRSKSNKVKRFTKSFTLPKSHRETVPKKDEVYAFMNIVVRTINNDKSFEITGNTVIVQIPREDREKLLPPRYVKNDAHEEFHFITKLFAKVRTPNTPIVGPVALRDQGQRFPGLPRILNPEPELAQSSSAASGTAAPPSNSNETRTLKRRSTDNSGSKSSPEDDGNNRQRPRLVEP